MGLMKGGSGVLIFTTDISVNFSTQSYEKHTGKFELEPRFSFSLNSNHNRSLCETVLLIYMVEFLITNKV